jgi:hypothetical protein
LRSLVDWLRVIVADGTGRRVLRASGTVTAATTPAATTATLGGDTIDVLGGVAQGLILSQPAILEWNSRIGVPIRLGRGTLAAPARTDVRSLPACLGQRRITFFDTARRRFELLLARTDGDSIHDRRDVRNTTSECHGVLRLVLALDPSGELDDSRSQRTDVDRALAEDRVVPEGLEHAILELFVALVFLDLVVLAFVVILVVILANFGSVAGRFSWTLSKMTQPRAQTRQAAESLGDKKTDGEACERADEDGRDGASSRPLVVAIAEW